MKEFSVSAEKKYSLTQGPYPKKSQSNMHCVNLKNIALGRIDYIKVISTEYCCRKQKVDLSQ